TGSAATFIVDSDSIGTHQSPGEIAAWNGGSSFVVEDSPTGGPGGKTPAHAVFKGLAEAISTTRGPELFAADVANAKIDIFDRNFALVNAPTEFVDPQIPAGFTPFNIQFLGGKLYVTYAKQNSAKNNAVPVLGKGFVDVYSVNGKLLKHITSGGPLDEAWGLAIAPQDFGPFAGMLLVGNLGNGWINAFNPTTGAFLGTLDDTAGNPIAINGLWGLRVGNTAFGGTKSLVFSAGPNAYTKGLVGVLNPAS
ncbi:MAG TPA: TIGR03118 family protein, partial [Acidimicrobiales bacterium]|nr:TIGR03118 family protein [Acidimicrobiales bacterium]